MPKKKTLLFDEKSLTERGYIPHPTEPGRYIKAPTNLGGLQTSEREHNQGRNVQGNTGAKKKSKRRVGKNSGGKRHRIKPTPVFLISFTVCLSAQHDWRDDDNLSAGLKTLRDCVCDSLGIEDTKEWCIFQYDQEITTGSQGVIVRIEPIPVDQDLINNLLHNQ